MQSTTAGPLLFSVRFGKCMDMLPEDVRWGEDCWHGRTEFGGRENNVNEKEPDMQDALTQHWMLKGAW